VNRFWSNAPKCVESDATAVDPAPQMPYARAVKVALAICTAMARATSAVRYRRRTYRMSSSLCPCAPPPAIARMPVLVP
jgi:hypothetical protein